MRSVGLSSSLVNPRNFNAAMVAETCDPEAFGIWAADRIAEAIDFEGPDTVAAFLGEPLMGGGRRHRSPRWLLGEGPGCLPQV